MRILILLLVLGTVLYITRQSMQQARNRAAIEKIVKRGPSPWSAEVGRRPADSTRTRRRNQ